MKEISFLSWIKERFFKISKRETSHTGILFGVICSLFSIVLIGGGFLTGLDDYLTTLVFQAGYEEPEIQNQVMIAKKDQATSELIGKNPGRAEFASLFNFLGKSQVVPRRLKGRPRFFSFFSLKIGAFDDLNLPIVRDSMVDITGVTEKIMGSLSSDPSHEGLSSLIQIESRFFTPLSANLFRTFSGAPGKFILPTFGLYQIDEDVGWIDLEKIYQENLERLEKGQAKVYPTKEALQANLTGHESKIDRLFARWENFFSNLVRSRFHIDIDPFPDEDTIFSIDLVSVLEGLPAEYYVGPSSVIAFDFILQGSKGDKIDTPLQNAIVNSESAVILAAHTKIEEEYDDAENAYQMSSADKKSGSEKLSDEEKDISRIQVKKLVTRVIMPDKKFLHDKVEIGMIDMSAGNKSFVTQVPMYSVLPDKGILKPSFSLITAMTTLDQESGKNSGKYVKAMYEELARVYPMVASGTFRGPLNILDYSLPVNESGRLYLKFLGSTKRNRFKKAAIPSASFFECFTESHLQSFVEDAPENFKNRIKRAHTRTLDYREGKEGKVVLAGPFELSDFDFYPTPLSMRTPYTIQSEPLMGVEIHANAILNILKKCYLKHPDLHETLFAQICTALLLGILLDFLSPLIGGVITLGFMYGIYSYAFYSYHELGQVFNFSSIFLSYPLIWILATLTNYLRQRARAQNTKDMFSRFVAADVVQYMLDNPELVKPGGQKVELTIFFSDVAGFTSISEALTPEELVVLLNEYLGAMTDLLFEYGGTLDKFIGDAVMAFWNYPREQTDHAEKACLCALAMQRKINELQIGWAERGLPRVSARAGLNTAGVVVGYMGSNKAQMNFTCMGDGVNLASRLEGANKEYGTDMMISDATYQKAKNKITVRFLDFLAVKGKKEPVKVHELVCEKGNEPPDWDELHQMYDHAIQLHLERKWQEAIETFEKILARWPDDGPSQTYLKRCHEYMQNPPPENWDGRYILTHK